jgi:asparagine synthase (glutamine-hydrolysing)
MRMCGLAGIYGRERLSRELLLDMAGELRHRGPDGVGLYLDGRFGMTNTRLAIVDLDSGDQPISDERGRFWVMQNGEIYNYVELREELEALGHGFSTESDTEVIAHAYEEWGAAFLQRLNGDFALAIWDREREELFLARDRFGVRPLFLASYGGDFCFASEAKALLRHPSARRELDPGAMADVFTLWSTLPDRSTFVGIRELPAAHYLVVGPDGAHSPVRWWDLDFSAHTREGQAESHAVEELHALLDDSVRIRLRADVPVAAYLSGGLDSSLVAALAARQSRDDLLSAFGVGFSDTHFDESREQDEIARHLDVSFRRTSVSTRSIADVFPRVIELAEQPLLRTAPAPLLHLSGSVRATGLKVVLTGEGADELFAGYDIFREDKIRRFWARDPESRIRSRLFGRVNRWLATDPSRSGAILDSFYRRGLTDVDDPLYSHRLRFANTSRLLRLLKPEVRRAAELGAGPLERLHGLLPARFGSFSPLSRAQYLEVATLLQPYLLHAQGDRMLMGSSVEGRFPYLDYRVAELAAALPDRLRLRGLEEKYVLRRAAARVLPRGIHALPKRPYRAPIRDVFAGANAPAYVHELLGPTRLNAAGLLDPAAVARLRAKLDSSNGRGASETDEMALVGSLSLMLVHDRFVENPRRALPLEPTRVVVGGHVETSGRAAIPGA